jgi:hypothetical protein
MQRLARAGWLSLMAGTLWASLVTAQEPVNKTLMCRVPLDSLPEKVRDQVRQVLEQPTLTTRGHSEVFPCKPALYYWFLDHPDQAAIVWKRLGAQCVELNDRGHGCFGWKDDQGSDLHWETVYRSPRLRVLFAEGQVRPAAMLPLVPVQAVLLLQHLEGTDGAGKPLLKHQAELLIHTDSKTAALIAKVVGTSAPKFAEQYVAQLQMFFAALPWYIDRHPEQRNALLAGVLPDGSPLRP